MPSMKHIMKCIGLTGKVSVINDFFGLPVRPLGVLSLLKQVQRLKDNYINLNIFQVGEDRYTTTFSYGKLFGGELFDIANAITSLREIYAREANLGIGRIKHTPISSSDAPNRLVIDNDAEVSELTNEWAFDTDAINVFFVLKYTSASGFVGLSDIGGACDRPAAGTQNGLLVTLEYPKITYYILAHEIGHYLGLCHANRPKECPELATDEPNNVMDTGVVHPSPVHLTTKQVDKIKEHCRVNGGCE